MARTQAQPTSRTEQDQGQRRGQRRAQPRVRVLVTEHVMPQGPLRPIEYMLVTAGRVQRVRCVQCGSVVERWDVHAADVFTCPSCGEDLEPKLAA